jgi:hypothetical protein
MSKLAGATAWTKRNKKGGEFMAVKNRPRRKRLPAGSRPAAFIRPASAFACLATLRSEFQNGSTSIQKFDPRHMSGTGRTISKRRIKIAASETERWRRHGNSTKTRPRTFTDRSTALP